MSENLLVDKDQKRHDATLENVRQAGTVMQLTDKVRGAMVLYDRCSPDVADQLLQHAIVVTVSMVTRGHREDAPVWSDGYMSGAWSAVGALAFRGRLVNRLKADVLALAMFANAEILAEDGLVDRAEDVGP